MDKDLKMDQQIKSVVRYSFFHLRLLSKVKSFLSFNDFLKDYTRFYFLTSWLLLLYFGASQASLNHLQLVQNTATHLLSGKHKYAHITPILALLH